MMTEGAYPTTEDYLPDAPADEVPRDDDVRSMDQSLGPERRMLLVVGGAQTGKSNLLAQFARHFSGRCMAYFVGPSPWSQRRHAFVYAMCCQASAILGATPPGAELGIDTLEGLFSTLAIQLARHCRRSGARLYFVVDGVEWCADGPEGERIMDLLPLQTATQGPFGVYSCRSDKVHLFQPEPSGTVYPIHGFSMLESTTYLEGLGLSVSEIRGVHNRCQGIPGYLKAFKDARRADPTLDPSRLPEQIAVLVERQVHLALAAAEPGLKAALEALAVSPGFIPLDVLAGFTSTDPGRLSQGLVATGLVVLSARRRHVEPISDIVSSSIRAVGQRGDSHLQRQLLDYAQASHAEEEFFLARLMKVMGDYQGLRELVSDTAILRSIERTHSVYDVMARVREAADMAAADDREGDLLQWVMALAVTKQFLWDALSLDEMGALLAMGRDTEALQMAYAVPDATLRLRMLSRAYASMMAEGHRIPTTATEELRTLTERLDLSSVDSEVVEDLAVDLLPVLPDAACSLVERVAGQSERRGLVEAALDRAQSKGSEEDEAPLARVLRDAEGSDYLLPLSRTWLRGVGLARVRELCGSLSLTAAREHVIRQWCRSNPSSHEVPDGVGLWLDTVVSDARFPLVPRSLRQIVEVVLQMGADDRSRLAGRLQGPASTALDSPKEEWVRLRLALARARSPEDPDALIREAEATYAAVDAAALDSDVRAFCYAWIWGELLKASAPPVTLLQRTEVAFELAYREFLSGSADQVEAGTRIARALVEVDPTCALAAAAELNAKSRRERVMISVLGMLLAMQGDRDHRDSLRSVLTGLDDVTFTGALVELASRLRRSTRTPSLPNLECLVGLAGGIRDPLMRARVLSDLAQCLSGVAPQRAEEVLADAVEAWREAPDLTARLSTGYPLVQRAAPVSRSRAEQVFVELQELRKQPGASIASGDLGSLFQDILGVAVRGLVASDLSDASDALGPQLEMALALIPSPVARVELCSALAARAVQLGQHEWAHRLVRTRLLPEIGQVKSPVDRMRMVTAALPALADYDMAQARAIAETVPYPYADRAWHSTVLWLVCQCHLGDQEQVSADPRAAEEYPALKKAVESAENIRHDALLTHAIRAVASAVEASFDATIDMAQALLLLGDLDKLASSRLPEPGAVNITHHGFRVVSQAVIHGARSAVYHRAKHKRGLSKGDIGPGWTAIGEAARAVGNVADRVLVLCEVAPQLAKYMQSNRAPVEALLQEALRLTPSIPTAVDRCNRLMCVAEAWYQTGDEAQAQRVVWQAVALADAVRGAKADDLLRHIVQVAHEFDADLADQVVSRLDSRYPTGVLHPAKLALEVERLRRAPAGTRIPSIGGAAAALELSEAARQMLGDFSVGRGQVQSTGSVSRWLLQASGAPPAECLDVVHWATENAVRRVAGTSPSTRLPGPLACARLAFDLASRVPSLRGEGIPPAIQTSFPGLSVRYVSFGPDDAERARHWLQAWLRENAHGYVKICDPYFGPEQLEYLLYVPPECPVAIVTSMGEFFKTDGVGDAAAGLRRLWRHLTAQEPPPTMLTVVPRTLGDRIHDRVIISEGTGLDLGPSCNGLGMSFSKVSLLTAEDASDLERTYLDRVLNNATWFLEGVSPTLLWLRPETAQPQ